jgi:RHS repeat-associated protein
MRKDIKQMKPIFDGLESVRGAIDDLLAAQERQFSPYDEITGTMQTPFGFAGEMEDENRLVYLRARYYSRDLGTFISQDPSEGSMNDPMSLNGYAYAHGNPINRTDPSGLTPMPTGQALNAAMSMSPTLFANLMNAGMCYQTNDCNIIQRLLGLCPTPPPPTQTPCGMRDNNGVNVLAATAITESDGFGPLAQDDAAVAALMAMQLNTFIATNGASWRELGTWTGAGQSAATIVADSTQTRILDIATQMVNGYCTNPSDPMALVNQSYPNIAGNQCLQGIAGNPDARFEVSIDATRAADFRADSNYPLQCVFEASGADRAIVVGGVDITGAWLGYQCAVGEQAVLARDPNTITNALSATGNYSCTPCTTVNEWWWRIPSSLSADVRNQIGTQIGQPISATQQFVRVNNSQGNNLNNQYGGGLYVASCS